MTVARHVRVSGRVQGVWFRAWTQQRARALGLTGWVRNCPDGSVEAHLEGGAAEVAQLIALLRKGPHEARVDDLTAGETDVAQFTGFEVRP